MSNPSMFKCEWIWDKEVGSNFASVKYMPFQEHENIIVFGKGKITYNPIRIMRSAYSLKCHPIGSSHITTNYNKEKVESSGVVARSHPVTADGMRQPRSIIVIKPPKGRGRY
jgi:site-specific DNA-methyltransferase (adenine-specific)